MKHLALAFLIFGACSSDDGGGGGVDAPVTGNKVTTVNCASSTPAATVTTKDNGGDGGSDVFMPMATTISVGDVVKFVMPGIHDVVPNTGVDAGLSVGLGDTKCLKFSTAGTFAFHCGPHGFPGTITVN